MMQFLEILESIPAEGNGVGRRGLHNDMNLIAIRSYFSRCSHRS